MRKRRPWDPCLVWNYWLGWTQKGWLYKRTFEYQGDVVHCVCTGVHWHFYTIDRKSKCAPLFWSCEVGFLGNLSVGQRKEWVVMALRKNRDLPASMPQLDDEESKRRWPTLWDHLTQRFWDDAQREPRRTSTLTLFLRDDGRLGASLNDREGQKACFAAATDLHNLLDVLEGVCSSEDTAWREDKAKTGSSARKKV